MRFPSGVRSPSTSVSIKSDFINTSTATHLSSSPWETGRERGRDAGREREARAIDAELYLGTTYL
jgi:hypothetical protein